MHTLASPTTTCIGHITGHPEWPVVLTAPHLVHLSSTIAAAAGFITPLHPAEITMGDTTHAIIRLAVLADDICALEIRPTRDVDPVHPAPDMFLATGDHGLITSTTSPEINITTALIGYRAHHAYFVRPARPVAIGAPVIIQSKAYPRHNHLVGFIEHIQPDHIATSRYIPKP
jgi:hypothetical protein